MAAFWKLTDVLHDTVELMSISILDCFPEGRSLLTDDVRGGG